MILINLLLWMGQFMLAPGAATVAPLPYAKPFTRAQANTFLVAAMQAEKIKNPLARCLAYPDPPRSHWDHAAVAAYCKYRNQPVITLAQMRHYIETGRAAELDKALARVLHEERTDPAALDRLDRVYYADFRAPSRSLRTLLDAWKRQSPNSAFAFAASGFAYEQAAFKARGAQEVYDTPRQDLQDMDTLSDLANADLQKSVELNPRIMPAWSAMISLGGADRGYAYGASAVRRALANEPYSFPIYNAWEWFEQPNWFGSLDAMDRVVRQAQQHATRNPSLKLLIPLKDFYRIDHCHCDDKSQLPAYTAALENIAGYQQLEEAADTALDANDAPMAAIYYSEALRFDPDLISDRLNRMYVLAYLGFNPWAEREGDALIAKFPENEYAFKARGWAYLMDADISRARKDFETATRLAPKDMWVWARLGEIYADQHQWNKAWRVSRLLIRQDPKDMDGWDLRARVQVWQPRPGLAQTAHYLALRYPGNKRVHARVQFLQAVVKQRAAHPHESNAEVLHSMLVRQPATSAKAEASAKGNTRR